MAPTDHITEYSRAARFRLALSDAAADLSDLSRQLVEPRQDDGRERGQLVQNAAGIAARAEQLVLLAVAAERRKGATWGEIGESLGISRQAAHTKYFADVEALNLAIVRYWLLTADGGAPGRPPLPEALYDPEEVARRLDRWADPRQRAAVSYGLQAMTDNDRINMIAAGAELITGLRAQGEDPGLVRDLEMGLAARKIETYSLMLSYPSMASAQVFGVDLSDALAGARARLAELEAD